MAGERIILAKLDFDVQELIKSTMASGKAIRELRDEQKELKKAGEENSAQYVRNEAEIKRLTVLRNLETKTIRELVNEEGRLVSAQDRLTEAMTREIATIEEAKANNKELTSLRNKLNLSTEEGKKKLEEINARLDENNMFVKENASTYEGFSNQISNAFAELNIFNGGLLGFIERANQAGGVGPVLSGAFGNIKTGIVGMTKASLAFIATPLGAILAAVAVVLGIVTAALKTVKPFMDKVEQAGAAIAAVFNVVKNVFVAVASGSKSLGDAFSGLGGRMSEAARSAADLKKAQQDLEDAMESQEVATAKNRAEIDRLNTQAKDRTKTEQERLELLRQAEKLEKADYYARKKNADEALRQAQEQIRIDAELTEAEFKQLKEQGQNYKEYVEEKAGDVDELFKVLKEAQIKSIQLDGEYNQHLEKNINRQNKLLEDAEKERERAAAERQKRADDAEKARQEREQKAQEALQRQSEKQQLLLDKYISEQGIKAKSLDDELKQAEYVAEQKRKIAQAEFNTTKKTENDRLKLTIKNNEITNELMKSRADAAISQAERVFKEEIKSNTEVLNSKKFLSDDLYKQKLQALTDDAEAERAYHLTRMTEGAINEQAYLDEINRINDENRAKQNALKAEREQAEKDKKAFDLETERILQGENFNIDLAAQLEQYDIKRAEERKAAEAAGADMVAFDEATAKQRKEIEKAVQDNKMALAANAFGNISAIVGKETALGKAAAIAQTTIDTYRGATAAYASLAQISVVGPVLGALAAAAAVASGLANVKKITSTKTPKAEKGALFSIGGNRHSAGGTLFQGADGTQFEAEKGELIGVMNRNAASHFMAFNNAFRAGGSIAPNYFANGGIVSREIAPSNINAREFAMEIGNEILKMPAPVVAVQDIITTGNQYVQVKDSANFG